MLYLTNFVALVNYLYTLGDGVSSAEYNTKIVTKQS